MERTEAIQEIKNMIRIHHFMRSRHARGVPDEYIDKKIEALEMALASLEREERHED